MAHIFNYAVLMGIPDRRRGERVNLGIVVFRSDRADVRLEAAEQKLRAITGLHWADRLAAAVSRIEASYVQGVTPEQAHAALLAHKSLVHLSDLGAFRADDEPAYERAVEQILHSLVRINREEMVRSGAISRINTEISRDLKKDGLMAGPSDNIYDRKVVKKHPVSIDDELYADFAYKNGVTSVVTTLDLRRVQVSIKEAALKSIILHRAKINISDCRSIGVYAVEESNISLFEPHLHLLRSYAVDGLFNWSKLGERFALREQIRKGLAHR